MYIYRTKGTCSSSIEVELEGNIVKEIRVIGGCNGNLQGISSLVKGMSVEDIESRLSGIRCGLKSTSCPDQIAKAVRAAYEAQ